MEKTDMETKNVKYRMKHAILYFCNKSVKTQRKESVNLTWEVKKGLKLSLKDEVEKDFLACKTSMYKGRSHKMHGLL